MLSLPVCTGNKKGDRTISKVLEEYTAKLYGAKRTKLLNKHRFEVFVKSYGPKLESSPLQDLKV